MPFDEEQALVNSLAIFQRVAERHARRLAEDPTDPQALAFFAAAEGVNVADTA